MFNRQTDTLANAIRLIVAMGGFVSAPGPTSGLALYDEIRRIAARPPKSIADMADALNEAAHVTLADFRDAPRDADILYLQMVEIGLLTPEEITAAGMNAAKCTDAMFAKIKDKVDPASEMRRTEMRSIFTEITRPMLDQLLGTGEYAADLMSAFMAESLQTGHRIDQNVEFLIEAITDLKAQTRDTLNSLARHFGEPAPEYLSVFDLHAFLKKKADDYHALQQEVATLRASNSRIKDILTSVEAAIGSLNFDEADRLLATAHEASAQILRKPLEDHARVVETQARLALTRGHPEQAFTLLSSVADSFAALDPLAPSRQRLSYARIFHDYGERYGGRVTEMAERLAQAVLYVVDNANPAIFSEAQNMLGLSLLSQGRFATDAQGTDLLERAAEAFTVAQTTAQGQLCAAVLDHLSLVQVTQAQRSAPADRSDLLRAAIKRSDQAIQLFADDQPSVARAHNNLGNIYLLLADEQEGAELVETLSRSYEAYDRATRLFRDLGDDPNMAGARFGVATVIERQATVRGNPALRIHAIKEFSGALQFYRECKMPQDAAMAAGALGSAQLTLAANMPPEQVTPILSAAETALTDAVTHYRETGQPLAESALLYKLALSLEMRAVSASAQEVEELLQQAQAHLRRGLELGATGLDSDRLHAGLERLEDKLSAPI